MRVNKEELERYLSKIDELLRNGYTPKPCELNLAVDFHKAVGKGYWKEYAETHPDVVVVFFNGDACFKLADDGGLEALR